MKKIIYLDHAPTTYTKKRFSMQCCLILIRILVILPASISMGEQARKAVDKARESTAKVLNAKFDEIFFTGGGTESG